MKARGQGKAQPMPPEAANDTPPEVDRMQIELLRKMAPERRLKLACDLTESARMLTRAGIRLREGPLDREMETVRLVEICYGRTLAGAFAAALSRKRCDG